MCQTLQLFHYQGSILPAQEIPLWKLDELTTTLTLDTIVSSGKMVALYWNGTQVDFSEGLFVIQFPKMYLLCHGKFFF